MKVIRSQVADPTLQAPIYCIIMHTQAFSQQAAQRPVRQAASTRIILATSWATCVMKRLRALRRYAMGLRQARMDGTGATIKRLRTHSGLMRIPLEIILFCSDSTQMVFLSMGFWVLTGRNQVIWTTAADMRAISLSTITMQRDIIRT